VPLTIGVIDCGIANLGSIAKILGEIVTNVTIVSSPSELTNVDKLILPGVGAFPIAMKRLCDSGLNLAIRESVLDAKTPILGICLGMQLFADRGYEFTETPGLGFVPGSVTKLVTNNRQLRVPHVGWNSVQIDQINPLWAGIDDNTDFYFVHSFKFELDDPLSQMGHTNHGGDFASVVLRDHIYGTQFHPEKSSKAGRQLLINFCKLDRC
jgi:glutamine amidotransferase